MDLRNVFRREARYSQNRKLEVYEEAEDLYKEKGYYCLDSGGCIEDEEILEQVYNEYYEIIQNDNIEKTLEGKVFFNSEKVEIKFIKSTSEYCKFVLENKESTKSVKNFYRGHNSWKYKLIPSIYRKGNEKILERESEIFKEIVATRPEFFENCSSCLDMLARMQHYGFPTRLMDLTENPLIALFFACYSDGGKVGVDIGEVITLSVKQEYFKYYDSDTVSVLCNIAKRPSNFSINTNEGKGKLNQNNEMKKLVHDIREEKPYFKEEIEPEHLSNYTLVVKAQNKIDRVIKQSGVFMLFGIDKEKEKCSGWQTALNENVKVKVFLILNKDKKKILEELDNLNINEATVFGDLDHVAKWIKGKYIKI